MDIRKIKIRNIEAGHQTFYAIICRRGGDPTSTPWVVATVDNVSIRHNSWYWGSYYETYSEAFKAFAAKEPYGYFAENANELRSHVSA